MAENRKHTLTPTESYLGRDEQIGRVQVDAEGTLELQVVIDERYINDNGEDCGDINTYYLQNRESERNLLAAGFVECGDNYVNNGFMFVPAKMYYSDDVLPGVYAIDGNTNKTSLTRA